VPPPLPWDEKLKLNCVFSSDKFGHRIFDAQKKTKGPESVPPKLDMIRGRRKVCALAPLCWKLISTIWGYQLPIEVLIFPSWEFEF